MENNRPKQILDYTFKHLEEALEERKAEKPKKQRRLETFRHKQKKRKVN